MAFVVFFQNSAILSTWFIFISNMLVIRLNCSHFPVLLVLRWLAALFLNLPLVQLHRQNNTAALCHWLTKQMCVSVWCIITQDTFWSHYLGHALLLSAQQCLFWQPWVSGLWMALGHTRVWTQWCPHPHPPSSTLILLTGPNPPWDNAIPEGSWLKPLFLAPRYIKRRQLESRGQSTLETFFSHQFSATFCSLYLASPPFLHLLDWADQVHLPPWAKPSRARPNCLQSLWILPSSTPGSDVPWALPTLPDSLTSFLEMACLTTTSSPTPRPPSAPITDSRCSAAFWILPTLASLR